MMNSLLDGARRHILLAAGIFLLVGALVVGVAALPALAQSNNGNNGNNGNTGSSGNTANNGTGQSTDTSGYACGSGYVNGYGNGYGGMMGSGYAGGGIMGGTEGTQSNPNTSPNAQRISGDQARRAVANYLNTYYSGQNLAMGEIMEFENNFYARIKEQSTGTNAFELLIDPYSGNVWPEYGPNMMWNTKYGHMGTGNGSMMGGASGRGGMMGGGMMGGGMMGGYAQPNQPNQPTANMPVTTQQAVQYAQKYLDAQGNGLKAEDQPDTFYGYYTIETLKDGQVQGMLSVNGFTGQVWLHTWHGTFIGKVSGD